MINISSTPLIILKKELAKLEKGRYYPNVIE
jgi:hypothetical protein